MWLADRQMIKEIFTSEGDIWADSWRQKRNVQAHKGWGAEAKEPTSMSKNVGSGESMEFVGDIMSVWILGWMESWENGLK